MKKLILILLLCLILTTSAFGQINQKPMLGEQINKAHQLGDGIGYWFMNEGRGDYLNDLSNNGLDMTCTGTPVWSVGPAGPAIDPQNANDEWAARDPQLNTHQITIISRLKWVTAGGTGNHSLISTYSGNYRMSLRIRNDGTWRFRYGNGTDVDEADTGAHGLVSGVWATIAYVYDFGAHRYYVNGILTGTDSETDYACVSNTNLWISAMDAVQGYYWQGEIDYIYLYDRALTAQEIVQVYIDPSCMIEQDNIAMLEAGIPAPSGGAQVIIISAVPFIFGLILIGRKYGK